MNNNIKHCLFITFTVILITIICVLTIIGINLNIKGIKYSDKVYPNTYLNSENISGYDYKKIKEKLDSIKVDKTIVLMYNKEKIEVKYNDLGIKVDSKKTINNIKKHYSNMDMNTKIWLLMDAKIDYLSYEFKIDEEVLKNYLTGIKQQYDRDEVTERFERDSSKNIKYIPGTPYSYLDVDKTIEKIKKDILNGKNSIDLVVNTSTITNHTEYATIDTKVSSFSTQFNPYISRATNLRTALNYINGTIIEPGEEFSFYKYAGPYGKRGYVFYYEFVGNGVCQIATTTYNAALLGGLEITHRYQHEAMVPYIEGGLDATVVSYDSGYYIDMSFKNTYKYPIYISAYYIGGTAYVDIWSNSNAKEGKTYKTESVKIGPTSYATYLHVYKDGEEIEKKKIATSWYKVKEN